MPLTKKQIMELETAQPIYEYVVEESTDVPNEISIQPKPKVNMPPQHVNKRATKCMHLKQQHFI